MKTEVRVYRYQFHIQVQMGHFADFQTLLEELNAALEAKGLVPFQMWEAAVGRFNEFLMVAEYEVHGPLARDGCPLRWISWTDLWSRPPGAS